MITCLIFVASERKNDAFQPTMVWAQDTESGRAWYHPEPLPDNVRDDYMLHLPASLLMGFKPLGASHVRRSDVFAYRMGIAQMDEEYFDREWVAAEAPDVVFKEPIWEGEREGEFDPRPLWAREQ